MIGIRCVSIFWKLPGVDLGNFSERIKEFKNAHILPGGGTQRGAGGSRGINMVQPRTPPCPPEPELAWRWSRRKQVEACNKVGVGVEGSSRIFSELILWIIRVDFFLIHISLVGVLFFYLSQENAFFLIFYHRKLPMIALICNGKISAIWLWWTRKLFRKRDSMFEGHLIVLGTSTW